MGSTVSPDLQSDVESIVSTDLAFAALKKNGRVITWGNRQWGGDSSSVSSDLQSDISTVVSTTCRFAALKTNGRVIRWGNSDDDSSSVISDLQSDISTVVSNDYAFAALKKNGKVITWGDPLYGGDSSNVSEFIQNGVIQIEAVDFTRAFRATKSDGTQIQWP